jgi:hypothetical protein
VIKHLNYIIDVVRHVSLRSSARVRAAAITRPSEERNGTNEIPCRAFTFLSPIIHFNAKRLYTPVLYTRPAPHIAHVYANLSVHPLGT